MPLFSLMLSVFMFVNPLVLNKPKDILIDEVRKIGYRPVVSSPFQFGDKRVWCVRFILKGERNEKGEMGLYEIIKDGKEEKEIFKTFSKEEIEGYTRPAFYTNEETPESVMQSIQDGQIFITAFFYLCSNGRIEPFYVASAKTFF